MKSDMIRAARYPLNLLMQFFFAYIFHNNKFHYNLYETLCLFEFMLATEKLKSNWKRNWKIIHKPQQFNLVARTELINKRTNVQINNNEMRDTHTHIEMEAITMLQINENRKNQIKRCGKSAAHSELGG